MSLDSALLWTFLCVFVRLSAMLLSSPLFGGTTVPQKVRLAICLVLAVALTPVLGTSGTTIPQDWYQVASQVTKELAVGLTMGMTLQLVLQALLMAGSFLDLQVGLGAAQTLNPVLGTQVTVVSQFKYMLGTVILLMTNGHLIMIEAFAASYRLNVDIGLNSVPKMAQELAVYIGSLSTLAMQIAAPVAATAFVVDAAMGIVNKAVPQMQVYVVTLPAKIAAGMLALAYGLPLLTQGVDAGMEMAVTSMDRMLTSGKP